MINLTTEQVVTLADASALLPRRHGKKIHISTIYRWAQRGIRGVRLETAQLGGTRVTSREALQRFLERLSLPLTCEVTAAAGRGPTAEARAIAGAEASLSADGFR